MSDSGELRKRKIDNHEVGKNNLQVGKNNRKTTFLLKMIDTMQEYFANEYLHDCTIKMISWQTGKR